MFHPSLKNIFYFLFDAVFRFTYRDFMQNELLTAIADSIATAQPVSIPVANVEASIAFILSRFADVDWDTFPDRITIFGDDSSIPVSESGDGDEGRFVLNLVFPVTQSNPYAE